MLSVLLGLFQCVYRLVTFYEFLEEDISDKWFLRWLDLLWKVYWRSHYQASFQKMFGMNTSCTISGLKKEFLMCGVMSSKQGPTDI